MSQERLLPADDSHEPIYDQASIAAGDIGNMEDIGDPNVEFVQRTPVELSGAAIGTFTSSVLLGKYAAPVAVRSAYEGVVAMREGEWHDMGSNMLETGLLVLPIILTGLVAGGLIREVSGRDKKDRIRIKSPKDSHPKK